MSERQDGHCANTDRLYWAPRRSVSGHSEIRCMAIISYQGDFLSRQPIVFARGLPLLKKGVRELVTGQWSNIEGKQSQASATCCKAKDSRAPAKAPSTLKALTPSPFSLRHDLCVHGSLFQTPLYPSPQVGRRSVCPESLLSDGETKRKWQKGRPLDNNLLKKKHTQKHTSPGPGTVWPSAL